MRKATIQRLLDAPGARVNLVEGVLQVGGKPASVPWFANGTLEIGVLLAIPRVGWPFKIDQNDPLSFGRFIGPSLFDVFERPSTLRKFLGLKQAVAGEYVTPIEAGSEGIARQVVDVLRKISKGPDWKVRFNAGLATGTQVALANAIPVAGGAADWAKAIIDAVEPSE
jgi:hypothetical protein